MLMTGMHKKKSTERQLIHYCIQYLPTKGHDTLEERAKERREERDGAAGVKQLKAIKLFAGISTDILLSPVVRDSLEVIEQS